MIFCNLFCKNFVDFGDFLSLSQFWQACDYFYKKFIGIDFLELVNLYMNHRKFSLYINSIMVKKWTKNIFFNFLPNHKSQKLKIELEGWNSVWELILGGPNYHIGGAKNVRSLINSKLICIEAYKNKEKFFLWKKSTFFIYFPPQTEKNVKNSNESPQKLCKCLLNNLTKSG